MRPAPESLGKMDVQPFRIERDSMGEVRVPADALWGAGTQRAIDNFRISGRRLPRTFIRALALVKSSFVELSRVDAPPLYERNRLLGRITRRIDAAPRSELLLDIGGGKSLTAVISHARAETLGLVEGDEAAAQFAPENVILAIA